MDVHLRDAFQTRWHPTYEYAPRTYEYPVIYREGTYPVSYRRYVPASDEYYVRRPLSAEAPLYDFDYVRRPLYAPSRTVVYRSGPHGPDGVLEYAAGHVYRGQFLDGQPHGFGTLTFSDGQTHTGNFVNGERHG